MVNSCCVPGCVNNGKMVRMYRFPIKDPQVCEIWLKRIGNNKLIFMEKDKLYKSYRVCGNHFYQECVQVGSSRSLKLGSLPVKNLPGTGSYSLEESIIVPLCKNSTRKFTNEPNTPAVEAKKCLAPVCVPVQSNVTSPKNSTDTGLGRSEKVERGAIPTRKLPNSKLEQTAGRKSVISDREWRLHRRKALLEKLDSLKERRNARPTALLSQGKYSCDICGKSVDSKFDLIRHNKLFHNVFICGKKASGLICPQTGCNTKLSNYKLLREHLLEDHDVQIHLEVIEFSSLQEFEKWKEIIEQQTLSSYTLDISPKELSNDVQMRYYGCHRSYCHTSKGDSSLNDDGSNKTGTACPARMEVTITNSPQECLVKVNFFKTHLGHSLEPEYIGLGDESKCKIAEKLKEGLPFDEILKSINENEEKRGTNKRLLLVKKKDLQNVVKCFKINQENEPIKIENTISEDTEIKDEEIEESEFERVNDTNTVESDIKCGENFDTKLGEENVEETILMNTSNTTDNDECLDEDMEESSFENNADIIDKASALIDVCSDIEISDTDYALIMKHLDIALNILRKNS